MIRPLALAMVVTLMGASIAPSRVSPPTSETVVSGPDSKQTTIVFTSGSTKDSDLAILDSRPEIRTVRFVGTRVYVARGGGEALMTPGFAISDVGFAHIANAKNLETLILDSTAPLKISDDALQALKGLKIKVLNLGATRFSAKGLAIVPKLESLTEFSADGSAAADVCAVAGQCPKLRVLTLTPYSSRYTPSGSIYRRVGDTNLPSDKDIEQLGQLSELEELYVDDSPLTDRSAATLQKLTKLRVLHVQGAKLTDEGAGSLGKLSKLEELNLNGSLITDKGMETIATLSAMKNLMISSTQVTDAGLAKLTDMPELRSLSAEKCPVEGKGFVALAKSTKLEFLGLKETSVTDDGINSLPILPNLARITLQHARITDACLPHLAQFPKLSFIDAMNTSLTDDGMKTLADMEPLKEVWLNGTKVTEKGVALFTHAKATR